MFKNPLVLSQVPITSLPPPQWSNEAAAARRPSLWSPEIPATASEGQRRRRRRPQGMEALYTALQRAVEVAAVDVHVHTLVKLGSALSFIRYFSEAEGAASRSRARRAARAAERAGGGAALQGTANRPHPN